MVAAGFRVVYRQDYKLSRVVSNPSSDIVKFLRVVTGHSESEARAATDDIQPNMDLSLIHI